MLLDRQKQKSVLLAALLTEVLLDPLNTGGLRDEAKQTQQANVLSTATLRERQLYNKYKYIDIYIYIITSLQDPHNCC